MNTITKALTVTISSSSDYRNLRRFIQGISNTVYIYQLLSYRF
jgi:hypothetical protein